MPSGRSTASSKAILFAGVILAVCLGYYLYTHRRQAYQLLHLERAKVEQAEERVRDSDAQFRGYFENMAVGALQLDAAGRYQLVNDRYWRNDRLPPRGIAAAAAG